MSTMKGKTEGGSGGKKGHSNMDHWVRTEEIKESTKSLRRKNSKREIREELEFLESSKKIESSALS